VDDKAICSGTVSSSTCQCIPGYHEENGVCVASKLRVYHLFSLHEHLYLLILTHSVDKQPRVFDLILHFLEIILPIYSFIQKSKVVTCDISITRKNK